MLSIYRIDNFRSESSYIKTAADGSPVTVVEGRYQYTSPKGTKITVYYQADETGYHANLTSEFLQDKRVGTNVIASLTGR